MISFFHKFFNPHCPDCIEERRDSKICDSCETLKLEIERLRHENEKLLNRILEKPNENQASNNNNDNLKPINLSRHGSTWNMRRQMLENEDRQKAKLMKKKSDEIISTEISTENLEKELGIVASEPNSNST